MLTHGGYYQQQDGLVMGSPPAPTLANEWMNLHNNKIWDDAKLYSQHIYDIIRSILKNNSELKLLQINNFHMTF